MIRKKDLHLFDFPWENDWAYRVNPGVLTSLLREQVPVLNFVQWEVVSTELGSTKTRLPLNHQSTNQHYTHQAALFYLAADYTGGISLGSIISGWPVVGIHPITSSKSVSLWLVKGEVKFLQPSIMDLVATAEIEPERRDRIEKRFSLGKAVLESVTVRFWNADVQVAEATMTYYARQSDKLRSDCEDPAKVNILYKTKLTSSAELIAGVRARESGKLFHNPYAAQMAGQHGMAIASRFCEKSPQLGGMVAARTRHLDQEILRYAARGGKNLIILGVGWDMRPFRLGLPEGMNVYELDFSTIIAEKRRRLQTLGLHEKPGFARIEVPIDVRTMSLTDVLKDRLDFQSPIFIAWEGMSMYLEELEVRNVLQGVVPLLGHPESRLWLDLVDKQAVAHPEVFPNEVQEFMYGMQLLGEPFTFGVDSAEKFMAENGLQCGETVISDLYFEGRADPVYSLYKFCVASRAVAKPRSDAEVSRIVHPVHDSAALVQPHRQAVEDFGAVPL